MRIQFFMPMTPPTVTHQMKRTKVVNGKVVYYEDERLKDARAKLTAHLSKRKPDEPLTHGVRLVVKWCFPINRNSHADGDYKLTKPDTDNLQKLLKDVMTDLGYWKDDALVASEVVEKFWSSLPGVFISVEELPMNGY